MFKITNVAHIPNQAGDGIKINDFMIGCARIVGVDTEKEETTFDDLIEKAGFSVGFDLKNPPEGSDEKPMLFFDKDLANSKNYVLVIIAGEGEEKQVTTIDSAKDICDIFGLGDEDAEMLDNYIGALATDRQLVLHKTKDFDGNDVMFFTNVVENDITECYKAGDTEGATAHFMKIMGSADYASEYMSDNFIKMFLIALIRACQDRYNNVHRNDALREAAKIISGISYWDDGQLHRPSVLDIDNYINDIKGIITVS